MEIKAISRPKPSLISPTDTELSWEEVNSKISNPNILEKFKLLFKSWYTVLAPIGTKPCYLKTIYGRPIYVYKN